MILLILALLFGVIVLTLLIKNSAQKGAPDNKLLKILKRVLFVETVAFIALFAIVIIKTLFM